MGQRAFDEFYGTTRRRVVTFLYSVGGDLPDAHDAAQEAYARAWQRWRTVGDYTDPEAWVRTVGYRLLIQECGGYYPTGGLSIEDEGFAGEESLLIRADFAGTVAWVGMLRQGDLVTEVYASPSERQKLVGLVGRAADRLCAATRC